MGTIFLVAWMLVSGMLIMFRMVISPWFFLVLIIGIPYAVYRTVKGMLKT